MPDFKLTQRPKSRVSWYDAELLNPSRSYDETRTCVRFWGYDGALEVAFFMEEDALKRISPGTRQSEAALLTAFDRNRGQILEVAGKVYSRGRKGSYTLTASVF